LPEAWSTKCATLDHRCHGEPYSGWREIGALLAGTMSREDCVRKIQQATRRYAKRQLTWFRRESHLEWVDLEGEEAPLALIDDLVRRVKVISNP